MVIPYQRGAEFRTYPLTMKNSYESRGYSVGLSLIRREL